MAEMSTTMGNALLNFAYYYPLFMAYLWMIGAIYYYFRWERHLNNWHDPPQLTTIRRSRSSSPATTRPTISMRPCRR